MTLRLEITSKQKRGLGETSTHEFGADGGTIGRSLESDWVLPDPDRYVSSRHATIEFRAGCYYVVDTSTNGVFINDSDVPVGRGKPQRLFRGDCVRIGDYEMSVAIEGDDTMASALMDDKDYRALKEGQVSPPDPTGTDLLDLKEITGAVEIVDMIETGANRYDVDRATAAAADSLSLAASQEVKKPSPPPQDEAKTDPVKKAQRPLDLEPFFSAAGLSGVRLREREQRILLQRLGLILREVVLGIQEALRLRSRQKAQLKLGNTTIQAQENNPLKFAATAEEALLKTLIEETDGYLAGEQAVRAAFRDVYGHQKALQIGFQSALLNFIERLDPEELQGKFDRGMKRGAILGATNKMKYWDLYSELYQAMTQHAADSLPQLLAEALASSYEEEIANLAGGGGKSPAPPVDKAANS